MIQDRLRVDESRKKAYENYRFHALIFVVGDYVFLCVLPMKVVMRF